LYYNSVNSFFRLRAAPATLDDDLLSRQHAVLSINGRGAEIEDLGSANGSFVNGTSVLRVSIGSGDRIRLGRTDVQVRQE